MILAQQVTYHGFQSLTAQCASHCRLTLSRTGLHGNRLLVTYFSMLQASRQIPH
jgi:hypothetical protein